MNQLGKFITLEGVDGAGKTSHIEFIKEYLTNLKLDFIMTREPGGTQLGERLREILLHDVMTPKTETILMFAARNEHIEKVIRPGLTSGAIVISDRFTDASYAYQSGGKGVEDEAIDVLKDLVQKNLQPDLTFLFDLPVEVSIKRLKKTRKLDKFEKEEKDFHENVRKKYLMIAKNNPKRFSVLNSEKSIDEIQSQIKIKLNELLK